MSIPERFMVWQSMPKLSHIGTWATTRYPEEAVEAVRGDVHEAQLAEARREGEDASPWRDLALQFDGHRMQAISLLHHARDSGLQNRKEIDAFLSAPPLPGEQVLANRIEALLDAEAPAQPKPEAVQEALEWAESQRSRAVSRAEHISAPEDEAVRLLCERHGYGAVMDSASRQWMKKDGSGAFFIGGCVGDTSFKTALRALAGGDSE